MSGLTALLPCKPDKGKRDVQLGKRVLPMELQGCEAQNTLFAISHIALQTPEQASAVVSDWRSATLANMRSTEVKEQPFQFKGLVNRPTAVQLVAQGKDANGTAVQAKLAWFVNGTDVFHLAVYGPTLSASMTEPLFAELRFLP
jgi:hypothetical protein